MGENGARYLIGTVKKALELEDWLASGDLLQWRTLREVMEGLGLKQNEAYRLLKTLAAAGRVEEGPKGWRISPHGVIRHSFRVAEYFQAEAARFGLGRRGEP